MKKLIGLLFLLIIIPSCIFALSVDMKYDNGAASGVDLSNDSINSNSYPCTGQHDISDDAGSSGSLPDISYADRQVIARIQLSDAELTSLSTIEIAFPDGLVYSYGSSERPYDIELVFRQEWQSGGNSTSVVGGYVPLGHSENENLDSYTFTVPTGDDVQAIYNTVMSSWLRYYFHWLRFKDGLSAWLTPFDEYVKDRISKGSTVLASAYIDVVLVLPELTFDEDRQMVYTGTDTNDPNPCYESTMKVNGGEYKFYGYYPKKYNMLDFNLTVTPTGATSINLNVPDVQPEAAGVEIAEYEYHATFYGDAERETVFYAFLSSSQDPTQSGGKFALQGVNSNIIYQAGISSGSTVKWFNGDDTVNLGQNVSNDTGSLFKGSSGYVAIANNRKQYSDIGEILFKLAPAPEYESVYSIPPGTYTSTIYFHVVANL